MSFYFNPIGAIGSNSPARNAGGLQQLQDRTQRNLGPENGFMHAEWCRLKGRPRWRERGCAAIKGSASSTVHSYVL
ncbi:MAG: hypothetical protein LBF66_03105 [Holosporales bacterium]|nr:hypothetical protein [Holosporales bacterium]